MRITWPVLVVLLAAPTGDLRAFCCEPGERVLRVIQGQGCFCEKVGEKLPCVAPGQFVDKREDAVARRELAALKTQQQRFEAERRKLQDEQQKQGGNLRDMDRLRQQVVVENAINALDVIEASLRIAADQAKVPDAQLAPIYAHLRGSRAGLRGLAARQADPGSPDRLEHALSAAVDIKNLVGAGLPGLGEAQRTDLWRALDTVPKLARIYERETVERAEGWERHVANLDDFLGAMGEMVDSFKLLHSTGHIVAGEITLWRMRRDRDAVEEAFIRLGRADAYYDGRLRAAGELKVFYEERLGRNAVQCPAG